MKVWEQPHLLQQNVFIFILTYVLPSALIWQSRHYSDYGTSVSAGDDNHFCSCQMFRLSRSQQPATCPYPKPDQSSPSLPILFMEDTFKIILPSMSRSSKWSLFLPQACMQPPPTHTHTRTRISNTKSIGLTWCFQTIMRKTKGNDIKIDDLVV